MAWVHGFVWWWRREAVNAIFALMAVSTVLFSAGEIWMMQAGTVDEFGRALWWSHIPALMVIVSLAWFVRIYLRAGRVWLAWTICGLRLLALILNFFSTPNINYRQITALHHVRFLGENISVAEGVPNPWMLVGQLALLLLVIYVVDAAITVWRRGDRWGLRLLSISFAFFVSTATGQLLLVVWGLVERPLMPSLFFLGIVLAMGLELGYDLLRATKLAEDLKASEAKYRKIFENVQDVFYQTDNRGTIIEISPSIERYSGYRREELLGQPVEGVYHHKEERAGLLKILGEKGEVVDHELRLLTKTGKVVYASVNAHVLFAADGKPAGVEGALRDITGRKQAEAALQESERQLRQSQKLEAIGQLAGGVAHDFNNILASTLMQVDLIGFEKNLPAAVQEGLEHIRADAERAARLTRQLLLFSRRQTMLPQILNLNDQVVHLVKMLQRIIGEDVHLELHLHPAPLLTHADAGMLDQVLMNLVVNARDAMPHGGRLRIETGEATVAADQPPPHPEAVPGQFVCLSVSDTGGGIQPEILPRIFEPFFTTKTEGKGTGLGLATVYGIVKQHQGWIQVDNRPGQGATFRIFLPASAAPAETAASDTNFRTCRGSETILLVEDEPRLLKVTRSILERQGYRVLTATNGPEALSLWPEHRGVVALLLTDLVMPGGLSGQELGRRLRADQPELNIIFTSGYSAEIAGRELPLGGGEKFIQKPYAPSQLLKVVRDSLDA
jgi:PAS domain S-box-containing protein